MNELLKTIKKEYGINADRLQPFHALWKLTGAQGTFLLKRTHCPTKQLVWLHRQLQELKQVGFNGIVPMRLTGEGAPAISDSRGTYIITPWQPGNPPSFNNHNHLKQTAGFWGELHQAAQDARIEEAPPVSEPCADLQAKTALITTTLQQLRARPSNNRIDRTICKWGDYFLSQAATSLEHLKKLGFDQWSRTTAAQGFCHNDPAPGNIIIQNKNWYLIDFELSRPGLFLMELTLLIQRALRARQWEPQLAELLLEAYYPVNHPRREERQFLPALLCFPRAFWRLCQQRLDETLNWSEKHFQSRLWELTTSEPLRSQFLQHCFREGIGGLP
jgi:CotS family spore coat protein